jgi:prepilin-type N-terminal cleavage/methylation domain-containing protein
VRRRSHSAGVTVVELMVVLVILAILAALSVKFFRSDPSANDARRIAALISTANRVAVAGGPVNANVILLTGQTARAKIEFDGNAKTVTVYRLVENGNTPPTNYTWSPVSAMGLNNFTVIQAVGSTSELQPSAETGHGLPTALGTGLVAKYFYPTGTVDAMTVYVNDNRPNINRKYRVVTLPLQGAPQTFQDW